MPNSSATPTTDLRRLSKSDPAWLALATLLFFSLALGDRDLWHPNEPTYGEVVVEMLDSGDWLVPRVNGEIFAEKPVLGYWLSAGAALLAGGPGEGVLRIPVMLAGVAATLLVALLIIPYAGRKAALLGAGAFATTYMVWWNTRFLQMDIYVLLSCLGSILAMCRRLDGGWSARRAWLIAGLAAGLGFSAKGPVVILIPGLVLLSYCALTRRSPVRLLNGVGWGLAVFLLTGSPWYIALWASGQTEAVRELLLHQNLTRYLDAFDHLQPWYFYVKDFWLGFAPWSWLVPVALLRRPDPGPQRNGWLLGWAFIILPTLFFSLGESKREPYLITNAAGVALLVGPLLRDMTRGLGSQGALRAARMLAAVFGLVFLLGSAWLLLKGASDARLAVFSVPLVANTLLVCGGAIVLFAMLWRGRMLPAAMVGALAAFYAVVALHALPAANPLKSHRAFAEQALALLPGDARLVGYLGAGNRKYILGGGFAYYMQRVIPHEDNQQELVAALSGPGPACAITLQDEAAMPLPDQPDLQLVLEGPVGGRTADLYCKRGAGRKPE